MNLVGAEGFEPPRLSHHLPKMARYQTTVYAPRLVSLLSSTGLSYTPKCLLLCAVFLSVIVEGRIQADERVLLEKGQRRHSHDLTVI